MTSIEQWLASIGLDQYVRLFGAEAIDLDVLPQLAEDDLAALGIPMGDRKRLLRAIAELVAGGAGTRKTAPIPSLTAAGAARAERRQLTVVFCDLVGSTDLAARLDPEDIRDGIRRFQECCAAAIGRFDGFIALYLGDGVLAYFGYPNAHEDDAERAIRAALGVVERMATESVCGERLQVRVGIATGLVIVGDIIGEGSAQQEAVTGATPNLAARLQALAAPSGVLIAARTQQLAAGAFLYEDLGKVALKGLAEPEHVWRVVGDRLSPSRFAAVRSAALSPLVGRNGEAAHLFEQWQSARNSRGRVVWLSGEPGIGKSRLVLAVGERIAADRPAVIQCQCSPFHVDSALHPVLEWVERAAEIARDDSVARKLDKLAALCAGRCADPKAASELLGAALLLPLNERSPALRMSAQRQKKETITVLADLMVPSPQGAPTLLIVEDAHWVDPTTLEVLDLVVERVAAAPVLAIVTSRSEMAPRWAGAAHVIRVALNRLGPQETAAMVEELAKDAPLPAELTERIVAKTDGIPLFAEELTKTVLESRSVGQTLHASSGSVGSPVEIPATLRDSLMARLDRLSSVKEVAQIGAAIGREFDYELVRCVAGLSDRKLADALAQLTDAGLLFRHGEPPTSSYAFKHALVQDAAYESLLRSRRLSLHQDIGDAIERVFPHIRETEPEVLARHYTLSGTPQRAIPYWLRAGQQARERSANAEAKGHLNRGLELLGQLPPSKELAGQEIELLTNLGAVAQAVTGLASSETETIYTRARELCEASDDRAHLFPVLFNLWLLTMHRGQVNAAKDLADRLSATANERADSDLIMQGEHAHWPSDFFHGEFAGALKAIGDGCRRYDPQRHHAHKFVYGGHDPLPCGFIFKALCHQVRGEYAEADAACAASMTKARELRHPFTLALCGAHAGIVHYFQDEVELVTGKADELIELSRREGFPLWLAFGIIQRGFVLARQHDEEGLAVLEEGLALKGRTGSMLHAPYHLALLAQAQRAFGQFDRAMTSLTQALAVAADHDERWMLSELFRLRGDCLSAMGCDTALQAEASLWRALEVSREQQAAALELRAATSLAAVRVARDRGHAAREVLARSLARWNPDERSNDVSRGRELLHRLCR